ncbi:hypothetical protein [Ruegeria sp. Ofav3-42]|uniref:hypothetical protein n=1 Tax=Ruegeria sp. Ofav3-42 TaxID=2917759 RepID=UPI001EF4D633|nr:hypothetical protein [Ruegeria sp. Ofav3-42]MCG7522410.1 hypothetical protein [Ruegeria sp. Ofav3-42]
MKASSRVIGFFAAAFTVHAAPRLATPQEAEVTGLTQSFGISSSVRVNDNFGLDEPSLGTTTLWDNTVTYDLLKETPLDRLSLGLSGIFRFSDVPQQSSEFEFDSPSAEFSYGRFGANSLLDLNLGYREIDLNFEDPLRRIDEDFDGTDDELILDDGTRKTASAGLQFETGVSDPFGVGLSSNYLHVDYDDTTDPSLFERETLSNEIFGRFRFSSVLEGRLSLARTDYQAEDVEGTDRTSKFTNFSLTYDIDPVTLLEATIGYTDIDETQEIGEDTRERGVVGNLGLVREMPNGSAGFELGSDLSINGRRDTILFERALELPLGGLEAGLGLTRGPLGETNPIGNVLYTHERPRTRLTVGFDRSYRTNDRSEETRRTRAFLGYEVTINPISFMTFNLDYASVSSIGDGTAEDNKVGTFRTAYVRDLTADWDFSVGYEYINYESETDPRTHSNEVFFTLSRSFTTR